MSSGNLHLAQEDYNDGAVNLERQKPLDKDIPQEVVLVDHQQKIGICFNYLRRGHCKFGDSCRFSHRASRKPSSGVKKNTTVQNREPFSELPKQENHNDEFQSNPDVSTRGSNPSSRSTKPTRPKQIPFCRFFKQENGCRLGSHCRFRHGDPEREEYKSTKGSESFETQPLIIEEGRNAKKHPQPKPRHRICRDFRRGYCAYGLDCRFWHPPDPLAVDADYEGANKLHPAELKYIDHKQMEGHYRQRLPPQKKIFMRPTDLLLENLNDEDLLKLRTTEIEQMIKRFPSTEKEEDKYSFIFTSSDPDWPYDVKNVPIAVWIPEAYPRKMLRVYILEDDLLPEIVGRQIAKASLEWIQTRFERLKNSGNVELMFRPFLKWLDKNIEDLFTEGLKKYKMELMAHAAGLEFIPACRLKEQHYSSSDSDEEKETSDNFESNGAIKKDELDEARDPEGGDLTELGERRELNAEELQLKQEAKNDMQMKNVDLNTRREGTEVKLMNLQLSESLSSLLLTRIRLIIKCNRCHNTGEISTPAGRPNLAKCPRCNSEQVVMFRNTLVHPYSSVAGYLDLDGCMAHDLILTDCTLQAGCLNCSTQAELQGLTTGQLTDTWCRGCHSKLQLAVESARLTVLQSTAAKLNVTNAHTINLKKVGNVRDPAIIPGKPLPNQGTCKHYKKSFRWLRFPCCGKAYPCDLCHDSQEMDHEMKYANRMICGFCCKEQSYSVEKPCIACKQSLTHKSSSHWEGGKGCRDKIRMSRDDPKKYANTNKTLSRKAQTQTTTGKKIIHPRHT